ncbi:dihydrolipoamide acetyltransferase family protein [Solirubrobacter soli]|uniref:dihydrolipoamide acetyltransferase family protein n=1 Tax=Solirubrobacter soli TaxID=363832 RepID=UPI000567F988|nr:dihydrolipoamide acetyltransferase family protein [Solirubrobacter soli]
MPRLSDAMEEGTIVRWCKADGDVVEVGDELVEIETDKATMPYEAEAAGVLHQLAAVGETVALGAPLAELLPERDGNGRVPASPVARRIAADLAIDLATLLPGSGPRGRVVKRDVERAAAAPCAGAAQGHAAAPPAASAPPPTAPPPAAATSPPSSAERPGAPTAPDGAKGAVSFDDLSRLQTTVARRMSDSRATVPDFEVEMRVDAAALVELRAQLKRDLGEAPSYNDFVIKACARALAAHPRVNGAYRDGRIERYTRVNIGVAVAAEDALLVPVVTDADVKSIGTIAAETRRLAERARNGELTPPELAGGTFTISNLGMFGVTRFTAVVNPPQAAILAVGALEPGPVVRDGELRLGHVMTLTLCSDHRILYGADAAAFLADVRAGLQEPLRLLV